VIILYSKRHAQSPVQQTTTNEQKQVINEQGKSHLHDLIAGGKGRDGRKHVYYDRVIAGRILVGYMFKYYNVHITE